MRIKTNSNIISGIIFMIVSTIFYILIPYQIKTREVTEITARTIPTIIIGFVFICSVALVIQGMFFDEKKEYHIGKSIFKNEKFRSELRSLLFIGMLIIYAVIFEYVGFIISSLLLATGILVYYKVKKWWFYLISYLNIGIIYYVFTVLLKVNLP